MQHTASETWSTAEEKLITLLATNTSSQDQQNCSSGGNGKLTFVNGVILYALLNSTPDFL